MNVSPLVWRKISDSEYRADSFGVTVEVDVMEWGGPREDWKWGASVVWCGLTGDSRYADCFRNDRGTLLMSDLQDVLRTVERWHEDRANRFKSDHYDSIED